MKVWVQYERFGKAYFEYIEKESFNPKLSYKPLTFPQNNGLPLEWSSLTQYLKERVGFRCGNCGKEVLEGDYKSLHVHHIDRNYGNVGIENLIVLCVKCHNDRHYGKEWVI